MTITTMLVTSAAGSQLGAAGVGCAPALTALDVPAHGRGERVGDELVEADLLALGRLGELGVERLRHAQHQPPAVAAA
jgi:hypothetical protein